MAIQLKVTTDTVFKQTVEPAADLPPEDKVSVPAGRTYDISSLKVVNSTHVRVSLLKDFLGSPPRNTWCLYTPHIQLIQPPSLKITQNTILKQAPVDSAQLPAQDKVSIPAGRIFNLQSWGRADNNHLKVALLWSDLGEPPRNTWYIYAPHFQFINEQPKPVPIVETVPPNPGGLPTTKQLNIPHKSQLDNALNPTGACNVTSFAMVMTYFQIRGSGSGQLEDELYRYMENNGLSRWDPFDLAKMAQAYGVEDNFTTRGSLYDIRKAIAEGRPCIIHGYFTSFGHIIVVRGYDRYGFYVNDPYGQWTSSGYRNDLSGANLHYSNALIQNKCSPEGQDYVWLHRLTKKQTAAQSLLSWLKPAGP